MEIHRQTVHADHFGRFCADNSRRRIAQCFVIRIPRRFRLEMCVHAEVRPVIQFLFDDVSRRLSASSPANCPRNKSAARRCCWLASEIFRGKRAVNPGHRAVSQNLRYLKTACVLFSKDSTHRAERPRLNSKESTALSRRLHEFNCCSIWIANIDHTFSGVRPGRKRLRFAASFPTRRGDFF